VAEIQLSPDGRTLIVHTGEGAPFAIHPLWLRERCTDAANRDPITGQRLFNPSDLPPDLSISRIAAESGAAYNITFTDGASSTFHAADMLLELPGAHATAEAAPVPWSAQAQPPAAVDWPSCIEDRIRLGVLRDFLTHGYIVFNNVPAQPGAVLAVARRFGYPRETNFGVMFDVRSVPSATDLAYTSLKLDPHTDNPYRHPVPGIQLLHCLTNETPGGLSTLVDGLAVAEALRAEDPAAFASLSRVAVQFRYTDSQTELAASAALMELDSNGADIAMHYSPRLDFVPLLPAAELQNYFAARKKLDARLKSSTFERRFRLNDGDLMMFDNRRLLHGRTGFDPQHGLRHLQGCYIDIDSVRSHYRVLRRRLA
jgi:gamma-butyrobetaine dioxygenase